MEIKVTSKSRTNAKRLLTFCGLDSRQTRKMTLTELSLALARAVYQDLVTEQQVRRALDVERDQPKREDSGNGSGRTDSNPETDAEEDDTTGDESGAASAEGAGGDENGSESDSSNGEASDAEDGDADGETDGDDGEDGEGDASSESNSESDSEADGENGDGESESEDDSASEEDDTTTGSESDDESNSEDGEDGDEDETTEQDDEAGEKAAADAAEDESDEDEDESEDEADADDDAEIEHPVVDRLMRYLAGGLNVALVGPAGTGKSFIARQAARKLDRDFYVNGAMMSKYDLIGYNDAHGTYHETPAYQAFTRGGVHCFDELDASAPDAVVAFNGMTDDQPFYTFPNGQHNKHADYTAIACMNTFGNGATADYVGRYKQDAAAMDRFVLLHVDYDARIEARIAGKHTDILQRIRAVRQACDELGIRHIVSYRMIAKAVAARSQKVAKRDIDQDIIFAGLDEGAVSQIKTRVNAIVREA